jgi:hypothetical protein
MSYLFLSFGLTSQDRLSGLELQQQENSNELLDMRKKSLTDLCTHIIRISRIYRNIMLTGLFLQQIQI